MFGADTAIARLYHICSPAPASRLCGSGGHHHGPPHPLCALRQVQPQCPSPIHDQIQSDYSSEGRDGQQRKVNVGMVVSCRIGTAVLRWQ